MNDARGNGWAVRGATLLLLAAAGCDPFEVGEELGKVAGCAVVATGHKVAEPIGEVLDALRWHPLKDDSGEVVPGVLGDCESEACKPRIVQVGTTIALRVDATKLAADRHVSLDDTPAALVSTDAEVISVSHGAAKRGECIDEWNVETDVSFEKEGTATLRVEHGADELARFSFEVAQAARLEVSATRDGSTSLQIEDTEQGTRSVRGGIHATVSVHVRARAADGRVMLLDDTASSTIDDPLVARFVDDDAGTAQGIQVQVKFLKEGSTTLRTAVGDATALVELQVDPSIRE